jgi:hypothetical protein
LAAFRKIKVAIWGLAGKSPDKNASDIEEEIHDVSDTNIAAGKAYRPGPYSGPIDLFLTPESLALYGSDVYRRWQAYGTGGIELHFTGDDHLTQLEAPFIQALAEKLEKCLARRGEPIPGNTFRPSPAGGAHVHSHQRGKLSGVLPKLT